MSAAVPIRRPAPATTPDPATQQALANAITARAIVDALAAAGVRHAVVSPGGRNIPLLLAMEACDAITAVSVIDERQAGFVALGLARATGAPVAAAATSGSAVAHYLPAALEASEDDIPLVLISADRPTERHGFGAPQTVPQLGILAPHVRHALALEAPRPEADAAGWVTASVSHTVAAATGPRPGPVHINAPFREPLWSAEADDLLTKERQPLPRTVTRTAPGIGDLHARRIADRLLMARRGVIVCGPRIGAASDDDDLILDLAERLNWPVVADVTSNLRFGRPCAHLVTTHEALLATHRFRQLRPDLVLRFGREPVARAAWEWLAALGSDVERIHVDAGGRWFDPAVQGAELVVSSVGRFADSIFPLLVRPGFASPEWLAIWQQAERRATAALATACYDDPDIDTDSAADGDGGLTEASVAATAIDALSDGAALFAGNSMPIRDLDLFARPRTVDIDVFANRGLNGIDGGIATSVGIASGREGDLLSILGDVTAMHDLGALALAADNAVGLTLLVVDNSGGRIFEHLPVSRHPKRDWFDTRLATAPSGRTDLAAVGRAHGLTVHEVTNSAELFAALRREMPAPGSSLIIAQVEPHQSVANRRAALAAARARVSDASSGGTP